LTHTVHRHEPGVAVYSNDSPFVRVVEETDDVLVVDKPGTLPVHACGGYHVQSLMNILEPFGKLYTIHRLDRLTSGLVILGKNSKVAQEWGKCIMDRNCRKIYLARVAGKFPLKCPAGVSRLDSPEALSNGEWTNLEAETSEERVVIARKRNAHGYWITDMSGSVQKDVTHQHLFDSPKDEDVWLESLKENTTVSQLSWFNLACPTRIAQPKDGICEAGTFDDLDTETYIKTVKPAETAFGVVRYDAETDSTVVLCRPATGRTHQIRIHLQHLGHPIANDPNYGGDMWHGNPEGLQACASAQEKLDAMNDANKEEIDRLNSGKGEALAATFSATIDVPATEAEIQNGISGAVREEKETIHEFIKRTCVWCARCRIGGVDRNALEFLIRSPGIWLHALQYSFAVDGGTKSFRTPFPSWNAASLPATEDQK
jgi:23S rRNA-/tRNA-specific pseudouridylate synthase